MTNAEICLFLIYAVAIGLLQISHNSTKALTRRAVKAVEDYRHESYRLVNMSHSSTDGTLRHMEEHQRIQTEMLAVELEALKIEFEAQYGRPAVTPAALDKTVMMAVSIDDYASWVAASQRPASSASTQADTVKGVA